MNRHVNAIAGRLSLRAPQRESLQILDRITEIAPPHKQVDRNAALATIRSEYPTVTDFERDFPSLCFALATGVGKTRLMGAFISYLHLAHGLNNFFVLAPNLTIYDKLITDFTPNSPKYVFKGIAEFATNPPELITGDTYEGRAGTLFDELIGCKVNIFNISKINSEVRGGRSPRIKRLSEYIGQSYFDYLAGLPDLVLIMDESHRYRASAGVRAINELKPVLGLELTATPFVESARGPIPFKNVILDYPLGRAMADGFVKEPAVVTRKNFSAAGMAPEQVEVLKLEDGVRLHEQVKVDLETYARETGQKIIKPFLLVIARDTTHAAALLQKVESDAFFDGRYNGKAIQVDSSQTGEEEDRMVRRLLKVEDPDEPTEIVIHVNMLKEGWDVTNLYTIVPLRAANARTLIEQSIGRGLRLPYGRRTGVPAVDTLNIVAHDRFQEIVDEANRPDSPVHLRSIVLENDDLQRRTVTVVAQPQAAVQLGMGQPAGGNGARRPEDGRVSPPTAPPARFTQPEEQRVAQITYDVIRSWETRPGVAPSVTHLQQPEVQAQIVREVQAQYQVTQPRLAGMEDGPNIADVVAAATEVFVLGTIDIPRVQVVPCGEKRTGFRSFSLDLRNMHYPEVAEELWLKELSTGRSRIVALGRPGLEEERPEDYVVAGLVDFDDISYDEQADLLYELAGQVVQHLGSYLSEDQLRKVLRCYQREIARYVHAQMQPHYWEEADAYETVVSAGFTTLRESAFTATAGEPLDYRQPPPDVSRINSYVFSGFQRSLYALAKFQSDTERRMAVILERDALRWFRPVRTQFQIFYRLGADPQQYQPDFVAEGATTLYLIETKARDEMESAEVVAKKEAAVRWCRLASEHAATYGGKPWRYVLVPHDAVTENMTLEGFAARFAVLS